MFINMCVYVIVVVSLINVLLINEESTFIIFSVYI